MSNFDSNSESNASSLTCRLVSDRACRVIASIWLTYCLSMILLIVRRRGCDLYFLARQSYQSDLAESKIAGAPRSLPVPKRSSFLASDKKSGEKSARALLEA